METFKTRFGDLRGCTKSGCLSCVDFAERGELDIWIRYLPQIDAAFDIGAHVGLYCIPAAREIAKRNLKPIDIYAFEPMEEHFNILKENAEGLPIQMHKAAICHKRTDVFMDTLSERVVFRKGSTRAMGLDDFLKAESLREDHDIDYDSIMIKADVEGAEIYLLEGMKEIARGIRNIILLLEIWPDGYGRPFKDNAERILELLAEYGFKAGDTGFVDRKMAASQVFNTMFFKGNHG